jgi:hypothetical protein
MIDIPFDDSIEHIDQTQVKSIEHICQKTTKVGWMKLIKHMCHTTTKVELTKSIKHMHKTITKIDLIKWIEHTRQTITKVEPIKWTEHIIVSKFYSMKNNLGMLGPFVAYTSTFFSKESCDIVVVPTHGVDLAVRSKQKI